MFPVPIEPEHALGISLATFFYGIYCMTFGLYLNQWKLSRCRHIYPLSVTFALCTCFICIISVQTFSISLLPIFSDDMAFRLYLNIIASEIYIFIRFITQAVAIHRCWILWDRKSLLAVLPSILALASFVTFHIVNAAKIYVSNASIELPNWFVPLATASFVLAFSADCFTTCFLALKLTLTHRETAIHTKTTENRRCFAYLRFALSIFIDSGVPIVIAQLAVLRLYSLQSSWFQSASSPATMISGLMTTAIIFRGEMASFDLHHIYYQPYSIVHQGYMDIDRPNAEY